MVDTPTDTSSPGKLYLFGGRLVSTRRMVNDLWELDLGSMSWRRKSSPSISSTLAKTQSQPQPRYFHSSDLWEGKLIIFGGMGYATSSHSSSNSTASKADELCVLDEIIAYDLAAEKWDFSFAKSSKQESTESSTSSSASTIAPVPRYAHLSSMTSSLLTIIGGQDMANQYVESISVFDLKQRKWIAQKDFGKQCGSYRSLAVAGRWGVREGKGENWSSLASNAGYRGSDRKGKGKEDLSAMALESSRLRAGSTASNISNLTGISSSDAGVSQMASPSSFTTSSTGLAAPSFSVSRRPSEMSVSTSTSSISTEYKDATLSQSIFATGGSTQPTNTTSPITPDSSKLHRQLPSLREISPLPSSHEAAETDPLPIYVYSNFNFTNVNRQLGMINFRRENQTRRKQIDKSKAKEVEEERVQDQEVEQPEEISDSIGNDHPGPPEITISDRSSQMDGAALPPGLRFPTGSILGSYLLISGTYLANTSQTFSIWALHLPTLTWSRLEPGSTLSSGSWNRAILWPTKNRLLILGHRDRSLVEDYNHRQTNWDHVVLVELEAWGIYQPPLQRFDDQAVELGLEKLASSSQGSMLAEASGDPLGISVSVLPTDAATSQHQSDSPHANDLLIPESLASAPASANALLLPLAPLALGGRGDMEILCSDGMKLGCDREVLRNRWRWFKDIDDKYQRKVRREMRKVLKQRKLTDGGKENHSVPSDGIDNSSSSITSPSSPGEAAAGRKRGSTMSDAIRALLEDNSDEDSEENEDESNRLNQKIQSNFDENRRPSTMSIQSQSTILSERSASSYRPFRTPTTGFSSGLFPATPSQRITSQDTSSLPTSHDPRFLPRRLILNEPSPIVLAFLQYLYSQTLCTPLQRHPAAIASLLILAAAYDMPDLGAWAKHAAHISLTRDLSPEQNPSSNANSGTPTSAEANHSSNTASSSIFSLEQKHRLAVVLTESAALCGCEPLQIRALRSSMMTSKWLQRNTQEAGRSRSGTTTSHGTERSMNESGSSSILGDQISPRRNNASPSIGSNRDTPTPTAHGSIDARSRSNSAMTSPSGSASGHVRRFSLTAGGQATSRAQPPSNAPPPAPAIQGAHNGLLHSSISADLEPVESGTDDSDSSLPPLNPSRKPSSGLSKAERMLGITGAEAQAAGLPGTHTPVSLGIDSRSPSQRRPSAGASTPGSMLSVRSGNSSGGGRKRFSIFGRSSNSSSTFPTINTDSTGTSRTISTKSSGDRSPISRSSGTFDEDGGKSRAADMISNHSNQGLVGTSPIPSRSASSFLTSSTSSGTLASHLYSDYNNIEAARSHNSLTNHGAGMGGPQDQTTMGRKSLRSRPSNSSSVVSTGGIGGDSAFNPRDHPSNSQLSSLRSMGTL